MLASLLPGVRELRNPLAAGGLWLASLWLLVFPYIPSSKSETGAVAGFALLADNLGLPFTAAALGFGAYLVGTLLTFLPRALENYFLDSPSQRNRRQNDYALSTQIRAELRRVARAGATLADLLNAAAGSLTARAIYDLEIQSQHKRPSTRNQARSIDEILLGEMNADQMERLAEDLHEDSLGERNELVIRLQASSKDLYDTYDRTRAEAEFRFAVLVPLALLIAVTFLTIGQSPIWLIVGCVAGLAAGVLLFFLGGSQANRAELILSQSIVIEVISLPTLDNLRSLSKSLLTKE